VSLIGIEEVWEKWLSAFRFVLESESQPRANQSKYLRSLAAVHASDSRTNEEQWVLPLAVDWGVKRGPLRNESDVEHDATIVKSLSHQGPPSCSPVPI